MTNVTLAQIGKIKTLFKYQDISQPQKCEKYFFTICFSMIHLHSYGNNMSHWHTTVWYFPYYCTSCLSFFHSPLPPLVNRESKLPFFPPVLWQMMMARCNLGKEYAPQLMESSALWDEYRALWETEANCTTLAGKCLSQRLSDSAAPSRSSLNEWLLLLRPFYWPGKGREKKKNLSQLTQSPE